MVDVSRSLALQCLYNQIVDGCIVVVVVFGLSLLTLLLIYLSIILRSHRDTTAIVSRSYTTCTLFCVILSRVFVIFDRGFGATAKQNQTATAVAEGNSEKNKVWDEARDWVRS